MADRNRHTRRQALRLTAVAGIGLAVGGKTLRMLIREGRLYRVRATRTQLGTLVTITAMHPERGAAKALVEAGFDEVERLEQILSRHRPESALSRLNRDGAIDRAPPELLHVVESALSFSRDSNGAFDPTVAPVVAVYQAWAAQGGGEFPAEALEAARTKVDYRRIQVMGAAIRLSGAGTQITLDGVAKGYVVDNAVDAMGRAGAERVLVDAGGDMASGGSGPPRDSAFEIDLAHPRHSEDRVGTVRLSGTAVATSGDYLQRFARGFNHHHIIDPRTGRSATALSSVTVVAPTAMAADALSTAVFVLGPDAGVEFLESQHGAEGLLVSKPGQVFSTPGWV